ncbi:MAG: hypothetical protein KKF68_03055 [Nanoarchaeota archaeon]|nr:hypothetical protein [Nanoarchaeota archaeon]
MVKRLGKKGADPLMNFLIYAVIGGLLIFGVGHFIFGWGKTGEDVIGAMPPAVSLKAQGCSKVYASIGDRVGWCLPTKINDDEYMNCEYLREVYDNTLGEVYGGCNVGLEITFCEQLLATKKDKYTGKELINGKTCEEWGGQNQLIADDYIPSLK